MRVTRLVIATALATMSCITNVAHGGKACVGYSVTAPVVGSRAGMPCAPSPFSKPLSGGDCRGVPPLGVAECTTFRVDLP
jgi:hypothetical protein